MINIRFALFVLVWPIVALVTAGISILINIPAKDVFVIAVGIILILIGLYSICSMRLILKEMKIPKMLLLIFG